jgi:hypothetical protein
MAPIDQAGRPMDAILRQSAFVAARGYFLISDQTLVRISAVKVSGRGT